MHNWRKSCIFAPWNEDSAISLTPSLPCAGGFEGDYYILKKAFIDALYLTHKKLRTLFINSEVKTK